ncbi:flippase-like domain-containing protein [Calothrix sp. FACHB-1219]|uniref:lysylphosphatidylglycerol synthase domain-containing protein n=1 Tax=unclassified Calothrix TaxID=2619626 RepID=UPI001683C1F2|nr:MULTISPECIES: lysylphosphatidylglycerol synthase domain-containing protein [unclassified Calothrix]MBD2205463.1 flippase-like domain-containing protein [Calothrix sp. FACHB-168]MBD2220125.1 flippase-like domain-containing protein [Calothrix sp. FACHB-1219]
MWKKILRWIILGGTLFFLGKALKDHWQEVINIEIDAIAWAILAIATGVTLLAHTWAGWIWTWVLRELNHPVKSVEFIQVYLKTNIAKYLPGNVWHHYGRIVAAKNATGSLGVATLSVVMEPLLMATAALIFIVIFGTQLTSADGIVWRILQFLCLGAILAALHPVFFNPVIQLLKKLTAKKLDKDSKESVNLNIERYPLRPLLGELGFLGLRGTGFILTVFALGPVQADDIPLLLGAFSFAWLLGFVLPGAPGGLGVFEATAIALLQNHFPPAWVISAIALYRLISIIAETAGAALAWLDERLTNDY